MEQAQGRNNARSLFGIEEFPSDNQIRNLFDPVSPQLLYPVFEKTMTHLQETECLDKYRYSHKVLTPVIAAPTKPEVVPLDPEFVLPQDGSEKQDCELNAAKRWIERHAGLSSQKVIISGDDLFSREPFCRLLLEHGFHFIPVCKPESRQML